MSLEQILQAIAAEGQAEIQTIRAETQVELRRIMEAGARESAELEEQATRQEVEKAAEERRRILQRARMKALETVNYASQMVVQQAIEQVMQQLQQMRTDPRYRLILMTLLVESLEALDHSGVNTARIIQADERDRQVLESCLSSLHLMGCVRVEYDLTCSGGVVARDSEERVWIDNTLDRRLERAEVFLRQVFPRMLLAEVEEEMIGNGRV